MRSAAARWPGEGTMVALGPKAAEVNMSVLENRYDIVDQTTFRNGMSRLATSVNVVSTSIGSQRYGFTASAVCSVSDTPPTLLVCMNRASFCFHAFEKARYFCVNTLMPHQQHIANVFGGRIPSDDRFANGEWVDGITGSPVLIDSSVSFECEFSNAVDEATHRVIFGRVVGIRENERQMALLYYRRGYLSAWGQELDCPTGLAGALANFEPKA